MYLLCFREGIVIRGCRLACRAFLVMGLEISFGDVLGFFGIFLGRWFAFVFI